MKRHFIGIDSGSTMCKAVLFDRIDCVVKDFKSIKTGWNPKLSATECLDGLLSKNNLRREDISVSATGYGREAVDFSDYTFTEITCHGLGAAFLSPDVQGVIDIGGQDSKVIQMRGGKVVDFLMNDKCAAGTGRFLTMACSTLDIPLEDIDSFAHPIPNEAITINSMCTVFAESEIIGALAAQKDRAKILTGVLQSISQRIRQMTAKFDFDKDIPMLMTGGLSRSQVLINVISHATGIKVVTHKHAIFAGAIGACLCP